MATHDVCDGMWLQDMATMTLVVSLLVLKLPC
jgi:hypothetical protein